MLLGIDVGGTFTDFVFLDGAGQVRIHKLLTSARDPSLSILQGMADLEAGPEVTVIHGATVATNALLERRGAPTALVTTEGFGDVLEIGRQNRPDLYALHPTRPPALVPAHWRFELSERIDCRGHVLIHPDPAALEAVARQILAEGVESVAVCLLFSFLNPTHEQQVRDQILALAQEPAPFVSLSCEVLPEYREYERTATTVINAYVAPLMSRYLANLEQGLEGRRLRIMQSNGGSISASAARTQAARTALSGPAGGVVGAFELARMAGIDQVISFDMGGTSTDVSLCPGRVQETTEGTIAGMPLRLPIIDIHTVGAGGGSIARLDAGGALRVGPESAGSDPGPICYGREEAHEITVTDAHLILGRLDADHFLGGRMSLDVERARDGMGALARSLGSSLEAAAWGVVRVANSNMERAIRTISVERGHDPRDLALVAFGGAGPLHACELASALSIPRVLIPPHPGVLSALGMVLADVVKDYSRTVMLRLDQVDRTILERLFEPLQQQARAELLAEGIAEDQMVLQPALDMRYVGQSYELIVPWSGDSRDLADGFHEAHRQRFTYASEKEAVEIVNLRLKAVGRAVKPCFSPQPEGPSDPRMAQVGHKSVGFADAHAPDGLRMMIAALYDRDRLSPGHVIVGPAIVFQLDATTVIPPGWVAAVDGWGNLLLSVEKES
jgi:N-methylhydantoinase A